MPPHTTVPPFRVAANAAGTKRPDRGENEGGVERLGRRLVGAAGPHRAEAAREILRLLVARAGEGEDLAALVARDLRDDVRGRAKAVDADALAVTGQSQRAVADQAGAQERRRLDIAVARVDRKAIALVGDG